MGHACSCHSPVNPCGNVEGLALQTEAPPAVARLAERFRPDEQTRGLFYATGERFIERVREALLPLSIMERASIRAVPMLPRCGFDPWSAAPVERVLARLESQWFVDAMNNEAFRFVYQPIVRADSLTPFGHEALVRSAMHTDEKAPNEIIEAAKAHNALLRFDQTARRIAITSGYPKLSGDQRLFINFLPLTVYDPKVCLRTTFESAESVGADFSRLVFEVVESEAFPDIGHLKSILDTYRAHGARVGLDDFGVGHTSLLFIDELSPDYLKLDKALVHQAVDRQQPELLIALVRHAQERGIEIIAEGIETPAHLSFAREAGVEYLQGFYIARPQQEPIEELSSDISEAA
jgi:EAL domain-containing protein (putative c-di-GMP-specific phosphodiesterase class I)